jgi:hypothetical protein
MFSPARFMNQKEQELRRKIMSAFEPLRPARSDTYVDCSSVRGDWDIAVELGSKIVDSEDFTCQLFSGHKGSGKSTELTRRLNKYLSDQSFLVVYFDASSGDLEPGDVQYADILLTCVIYLLKAVPNPSIESPHPLITWLQQNWEWIKQFIPERVSVGEIKTEVNLGSFGKLVTTLKTDPDRRPEIRRKVNEQTNGLLTALNEFIDHAQKSLPDNQKRGIVLIVDSLDRILSVEDETRQNWRDIYINRSALMRGLHCHVIYTVDVALVYSSTESELREKYGSSVVLPMVTVRYLDNRVNQAGIDILRQLVEKRIAAIDPTLIENFEGASPSSGRPEIFASPEILEMLCLMSGGRVRALMHLVQDSLKYNGSGLTITEKSMGRALQELSNSYSNEVDDYQWEILAFIATLQDKTTVRNNSKNFALLRSGHLLEYRYYRGDKLDVWRNVHPLITICRRFKEAVEKLGGDG